MSHDTSVAKTADDDSDTNTLTSTSTKLRVDNVQFPPYIFESREDGVRVSSDDLKTSNIASNTDSGESQVNKTEVPSNVFVTYAGETLKILGEVQLAGNLNTEDVGKLELNCLHNQVKMHNMQKKVKMYKNKLRACQFENAIYRTIIQQYRSKFDNI